jgi:hypothetical protein
MESNPQTIYLAALDHGFNCSTQCIHHTHCPNRTVSAKISRSPARSAFGCPNVWVALGLERLSIKTTLVLDELFALNSQSLYERSSEGGGGSVGLVGDPYCKIFIANIVKTIFAYTIIAVGIYSNEFQKFC